MNTNKIIVMPFVALMSFSNCWALRSSDASKTEKTVIEKLVPSELTNLKEPVNSQQLSIGNGITYHFARVEFNRKKYLAVAYLGSISPGESICSFKLIQDSDNSKAQFSANPVLHQIPAELDGCSDVEVKDLDGDGVPEVIVHAFQFNTEMLYFFKWDKDHLTDITPSQADSKGSLDVAFSNPAVSTTSVNGKAIIIDTPNVDDTSGLTKIYTFSNGQIHQTGSYNFFKIIEKKFWKTDVVILNPSFSSEGAYTLDIKNLSKHSRSVRVEVIVNDSIVLKPQDFCSSPQPKKTDKDKWRGNDDDDDKDEDHCKRCIPKNEAYAIVNLKKTNEIKVKIFGMQSSKIQLTLTKK